MANVCDVCGKKPMSGCNVSHAHNKTKKVFKPNLQKLRAQVGGGVKTLTVCTSCIKAGKVKKAGKATKKA